ncbi:helix-turn-helix domain-containing protein [Spirillospora sp. CA-294931]|uniref:helix-turn-helix domain-containing protein n=1 Tax=Spirillospora sp. CA-294931 TaxID=3240042 RepID=UPI003D8BCA26
MGSATTSVRWRRIGSALREIREANGLTLGAVSRRYGRSSGWFSTLENGQHTIDTWELVDLLDMYEVAADSPLRESLLYLSMRGRGGRWQRPWEGKVSAAALDLASLEEDSNLLRETKATTIPGLLQDRAYTEAQLAAGLLSPSSDPQALVEFRMSRQRVLTRPDRPRYEVVIGEAALRQHIGGAEILRAQLRSLLDHIQAQSTDLRILDHTASIDPGPSAPFLILNLRPPGRLTTVLVDGYTHGMFIADEKEVAEYEKAFNHLRAAALDESESHRLIEQILSEI